MSQIIVCCLLVVMTILAVPTVEAQTQSRAQPTLDAGTRVRVERQEKPSSIIGVVVSHSSDTLVVKRDADGRLIAVPSAQLLRVDRSAGTRTRKLKGASIGYLGGSALGFLVGEAAYDDTPCDGPGCPDFSGSFKAAVVSGVGGILGAIAGTVVGMRSRERWIRATDVRAGDARINLAPSAQGGLALSASLTF